VGNENVWLRIAQKLITMDDGAALLLSVAKYYTPSGVEIQANGIKPTVESLQANEEPFNPDDETEVVQPSKPVTTDEDKQLKKAIEILRDPSKAALKPAA
jgi:carboxyl-terminal processing protease